MAGDQSVAIIGFQARGLPMPKVAPKGLDPGYLPSEEFLRAVLASYFCEHRGVVCRCRQGSAGLLFHGHSCQMDWVYDGGWLSSVPSACDRLL